MKTSRLARTALAASMTAVALVASGCGTKEEVTTEAKTEGIWIDAGKLDYHVQGSRLLEPGQTPDASYLKGLPAGTAQPEGDEVWFAVFLRVENRTAQAAPSAKEFEIVDPVGHPFSPYGIDPEVNPFA